MKNPLLIGLTGLLFIALVLNVVWSQSVSPLFFDLVKGDQTAAVVFLQKIKLLPDFQQKKETFDEEILAQFNVVESEIQEEIEDLEAIVEKNPFVRDVLYRLYLLYEHQGKYSQAKEYLRRAVEVDPTIK